MQGDAIENRARNNTAPPAEGPFIRVAFSSSFPSLGADKRLIEAVYSPEDHPLILLERAKGHLGARAHGIDTLAVRKNGGGT